LQAESPLTERILVAATGPLITVLLGGLIVWGVTYKIQQNRAEADRRLQQARDDAIRQLENERADHIRAQDQARADAEAANAEHSRDDALRQELVMSMTQAAGALYLTTQHYWRAKRDLSAATADQTETLRQLRADLDATYLNSRISGEVIENRLEGYFTSSAPRDRWHTVMDLLTVRYFQLIDRASDQLYEKNAGEGHSGLSVADMKKRDVLLARYRDECKRAVRSVFDTPLRARS
jgi:hypothetical protein